MSFLVPLYLAGALAVAIPIYLHLRRRPPKDSVEFSSLMFLEPTKHQPLKRRSQLENIPLLLLRCLALLLLAAMFARPFFPGESEAGNEGKVRTVVLIDASASMQRNGIWEDAIRAAEEVVAGMKPEGALAIIAIDRSPQTLTSFEDWDSVDTTRRKEVARAALSALQPSWLGSDLGAGLLAAAEALADASSNDETPRAARVVLISDLQSGAALEAVSDASWPEQLKVDLVPVEAAARDNVSLVMAAAANADRPNIRLRNDPLSEGNRFTITAGDRSFAAVVPAGESRVFQLDAPVSEVRVEGDGQPFDNRLFLAPREPALVKLLFLGDGKPDDSNGPEYYYRRALAESKIMLPRFVDSLEGDPALFAVSRPLSKSEVRGVRETLTQGRDAILLVSSTEMAETLASLAGLPEAPDLREHDRRYALLEDIDFDHPLLREFQDPRWRDFSEVRFWRYRRIDERSLPEDATIVARFDTGDPAWIEFPVGEGSLLAMMSGWHPRDSQLSLSSKFLPLLFSIYSDHGPQVTGARQFFVGDPLPLEEDELSLTHPDGRLENLESGSLHRPAEPGIYRVSNGERERSFAVNLRPSESELTPLETEALTALGIPTADSPRVAPPDSEDTPRTLRNQEAEAEQHLWRWAVIILLGMLVVEAWLATRTGTPESQPAVT